VPDQNLVNDYCKKWNLSAPQPIATTPTSNVFKVVLQGQAAVLKILNEKGRTSETLGATVLRYFNGNGAVKLLQADEGAHLLEYVDGRSLKEVVEKGNDEQATQIICNLLHKLHSHSDNVPPSLISMEHNFHSLFSKASEGIKDDIYITGAKVAKHLISTEREVRVLHGDIHHENILESSSRGWLAIDPKNLKGERTYDVANVFYNPNGFLKQAATENVIKRRCEQFSRELGLDKKRILEFAFAYGCLSAAWCIEDNQNPEETLAIARAIQRMITTSKD